MVYKYEMYIKNKDKNVKKKYCRQMVDKLKFISTFV